MMNPDPFDLWLSIVLAVVFGAGIMAMAWLIVWGLA